jgi:hypothetical protein
MRTNGNTVETLVRRLESCHWFDYERALWVMAFVVKLMRFGSVARHDNPRGEQAAMRLASHLGQLVEDPMVIRAEEQQEQDVRKERFHRALADNQRYGWKIPDSQNWTTKSACRSVEGTFADAQLINHFVREFLVAFGLVEKMKLVLPALQNSDDPVFTVEAWPRWWHWAETEFLA